MIESIIGGIYGWGLGWGVNAAVPHALTQVVTAAVSSVTALFSSAAIISSAVAGVPLGIGAPFELLHPTVIEAYSDQTFVVSFDDVFGLIPGSPVVVNGQIAGKVERITPSGENSEIETVCDKKGTCSKQAVSNFSVNITLTGNHTGSLKKGTVGVITSPAGRDELSAVELLVPEIDSPIELTDPIAGFSSFEKFWTSGGLV